MSSFISRCILVCAVGALVAACSTTSAPEKKSSLPPENSRANPYGEANPHRKVGNPYKVAGIWYYPEKNDDYDKVGIASWYGPKFHGRKTANGEIFDMNQLTAAHPTLPLPSIVRVTNLDTNRSMSLRLNDRGPFAHGRIIDLSRAAAEQLGFRQDGLARVRVEYIADARLEDAITALGQTPHNSARHLAGYTGKAASVTAPEYDTVNMRIATGPEIKVEHPLATVEDLSPVHIQDARVAVFETEAAIDADMAKSAPKLTQGNVPEPRVAPLSAPVAASPVTTASTRISAQPARFVQVGAFASQENATSTANRLSDLPVRSSAEETANGSWIYQVRLGPFSTQTEIDEALAKARDAGFSDAHIVELR